MTEKLLKVFDFPLVVPADYRHATQLQTFAARFDHDFKTFDKQLTDANFARTTDALQPGRTYRAQVYTVPNKQKLSSADGLKFLAEQRGLLVSAQGLSLIWSLAPAGALDGKWLFALDREEALPKDNKGKTRAPLIGRYSAKAKPEFFRAYFQDGWMDIHSILCVIAPSSVKLVR
jgi:hypothetical protein